MSSLKLMFLLAALAGLAAAPAASGADRLAVAQIRCAPCAVGISLVAPSGGGLAVLTRHAGWEDDDPAWSPDGRRLAFTRSTDGRRSTKVYVMNADGSGVRRLTRGAFDERPAWSPDGRWIAYAAATSGIRLVRPDGTGARRVPGTSEASWPAWAPDGRRLAFAQGGFVVSARLDGRARRRIARGREPDWSPDGRQVAFTGPDGGVFVAPASGGTARRLHSGMQPDWSPDGTRIAFTRWPASGVFSVWVMAADGHDVHRTLSDARSPDWRP